MLPDTAPCLEQVFLTISATFTLPGTDTFVKLSLCQADHYNLDGVGSYLLLDGFVWIFG